MSEQYITKIIEDPETKELGILLTEELMKKLDLHINEYLEWSFNGKEIILKKTKYINNN